MFVQFGNNKIKKVKLAYIYKRPVLTEVKHFMETYTSAIY